MLLFAAGVGRQSPSDMVSWLFGLSGDCWNDFFPAGPQARVRSGAILFYNFMKAGEIVIGNEGEHMVLNMVVHIEIKEPVYDVGEEGS